MRIYLTAKRRPRIDYANEAPGRPRPAPLPSAVWAAGGPAPGGAGGPGGGPRGPARKGAQRRTSAPARCGLGALSPARGALGLAGHRRPVSRQWAVSLAPAREARDPCPGCPGCWLRVPEAPARWVWGPCPRGQRRQTCRSEPEALSSGGPAAERPEPPGGGRLCREGVRGLSISQRWDGTRWCWGPGSDVSPQTLGALERSVGSGQGGPPSGLDAGLQVTQVGNFLSRGLGRLLASPMPREPRDSRLTDRRGGHRPGRQPGRCLPGRGGAALGGGLGGRVQGLLPRGSAGTLGRGCLWADGRACCPCGKRRSGPGLTAPGASAGTGLAGRGRRWAWPAEEMEREGRGQEGSAELEGGAGWAASLEIMPPGPTSRSSHGAGFARGVSGRL